MKVLFLNVSGGCKGVQGVRKPIFQVLPSFFCSPDARGNLRERRWVMPYPIGFNSHKNVSTFAEATAGLYGAGAAFRVAGAEDAR